jgi:thiol-disulfide isomerase/thioredoxin
MVINAVAGVAALLLVQLASAADTGNYTVKFAQVAPARADRVQLALPEGQAAYLEPSRGQVSIVHFWASWCAPCLREMPELEQLAKRYPEEKLRIITIAADSHTAVRAYQEAHKLQLSVLIDQYGAALRSYRVKVLPSSMVIDQQGQIRYRADGPVAWQGSHVKAILDALIE